MKQNWPSWFYGPDNQSQIFNGPLEVPDGWHDSPDKFDEDGKPKPGAKTEIPDYEEAVKEQEAKAAAAEEDDDSEPEDGEADESNDVKAFADIDRSELREELDGMEVEYEKGDRKAALYDKYKAAKQGRASAEGGNGDGTVDNTTNVADPAVDSSHSGAEGQDQRPETIAPMDVMTDDDINGRLTRANVAYNTSWGKKRRWELLKDHLGQQGGNRLGSH